jgi:hypothetical protein
MACNEEDVKELYPKYYEEKTNEGLIEYLLQEFKSDNLYVKDKGEMVKVEEPEPLSKEEADKLIEKLFDKKGDNDD